MKSVLSKNSKHIFIFEKSDDFLKKFEIVLGRLEFICPLDDKFVKDVYKLNSTSWDFENDKYEIDVVFSKETVALIIRTDEPKDNWIKYVAELDETV